MKQPQSTSLCWKFVSFVPDICFVYIFLVLLITEIDNNFFINSNGILTVNGNITAENSVTALAVGVIMALCLIASLSAIILLLVW